MSKSLDKLKLYASLTGTISGIVITIFIFNVGLQNITFRFLAIFAIYFLVFVLIKTIFTRSDSFTFIATTLTPFLIDLSVLVTNRDLIPIRFPISTIFVFAGAFLGVLIQKSLRYKIIGTSFICLYFYSSIVYIIPSLLFKEEVQYRSFNKSFLASKFLTIKGDTIKLNSSKSKVTVIDFMFVGCSPCELKRKMLTEVDIRVQNKNLAIYIICNGNISTYESFKKYYDLNPEFGHITFLYDYENNISEYFPDIDTYPFELLLDDSSLINSYTGISEETYLIHRNNRINTIKKLLNE